MGALRLTFSDDYREIFRSESEAFALLEEIAAQFGGDEQRIVVLAEGPEVLAADSLDWLERARVALQSDPRIEQVVSPHHLSGLPRLLANAEHAATREQIATAIRTHPALGGQLIATDLSAVLMVVDLDPEIRTLDDIEPLLERIHALTAAPPQGVEVFVTGIPLIRTDVVRGVQRDQVVFTSVGLLLGGIISWLVFRHPVPALLVGIGPAAATLWTTGVLGWSGHSLDVVNNVVPVLVLVVGMTDSVHLLRRYQQLRASGHTAPAAALGSLRAVGKACALTSATTVLGFASLALADVAIVRGFGLTCALGLALSFVAVTTILPLLCSGPVARWIPSRHEHPWPPAPAWPLRKPRLVAALGLSLLVLASASFLQLSPDYRYREYLPDDSPALAALQRVETHFGGSFPLHVVVDWEGPASGALFAVLHEVDELLESTFSARPSSILGVTHAAVSRTHTPQEDAIAARAVPTAATRQRYLPELGRALVSVPIAGRGAASLAPEFAQLRSRLAEIARAQPQLGLEIELSGLLYVSSIAALDMIATLFRSLLVAAPLIFALVSWGLGSLRLGMVSIAPNLLPVAALATLLAVMGRPLQFTTTALFTIALAIAVDDTIHMLMDYRHRRSSAGKLDAMRESIQAVGPSLSITTALLLAGFGAVGLSRAPMMSLFGWLGCAVFIVALVADLVFLPALVVLADSNDTEAHA